MNKKIKRRERKDYNIVKEATPVKYHVTVIHLVLYCGFVGLCNKLILCVEISVPI